MAEGIKFPFENTDEGGLFASNDTTQEKEKSNLLILLTTKRGQRPMQNDFFSPIYDYIHEQKDEILKDKLTEDIQEKIEKFMSNIRLLDVRVNKEEERNMFSIKIIYKLIDIPIEDSVDITLPLE